MILSKIESDFLCYLLESDIEPGERLPSLADLSDEIGVSMGKLREQLEVARTMGLVEASPRRGITRLEYDFGPAVRLSLLMALGLDPQSFQAFGALRLHLEASFWDEAVVLLTPDDVAHLQGLVESALHQLRQPYIRIPHQEHRELHLTIFKRLQNPFVKGLLDAYWEAYEAAELNTYADYEYLLTVWQYHENIVDAIARQDYECGKRLLIEHMSLLNRHGMASPGAVHLGGLNTSGLNTAGLSSVAQNRSTESEAVPVPLAD